MFHPRRYGVPGLKIVQTRLGSRKTHGLVVEIVRLSERYDCNTGEILDGIGNKLGICSWCLKPRHSLVEGVCSACRAEAGWE